MGKTTFCSASIDGGFEILSASGLIRQATSEIRYDERKRVADIEGNQALLLKALGAVTAKGGRFLLDGHFALFNTDGGINRIPVETFREINPSALAVIIDDPSEIFRRLQNRDGGGHSEGTLSEMQKFERDHAKAVATELSVPLTEIQLGDATRFKEWIAKAFPTH